MLFFGQHQKPVLSQVPEPQPVVERALNQSMFPAQQRPQVNRLLPATLVLQRALLKQSDVVAAAEGLQPVGELRLRLKETVVIY